MKRAIVTGGCGFIGSHLAEIISRSGMECTVVDNLFHKSAHNLDSVKGKVKLLDVDITDRKALKAAFAEAAPEVVFHLAAHHFIPYCNEHPLEAIATNMAGTQNIADLSAAAGVKRIFFASTAAVYGISDVPHREEDTADPLDIYGLTKYAGERIMGYLYERAGTQVAIGRFFNAVGPRETNPHIIPEILKQLRETRGDFALKLGNVKPKRDYIHAYDLAQAAFQVTLSDALPPFEVVNIGSGVEHSVEDLVGYFSESLGAPIRLESVAARKRKLDRLHLCADIGKITGRYGWRTTRDLKSSVAELAATV